MEILMQIDWTINITHIVTILGLAAGIIATWAVLRYRVQQLGEDIKSEKDGRKADVDRLSGLNAAAVAQAALVDKQLQEYKTHVAETYVSKQGLREVRDEIMTGVRDLKGSVSTIHDRIDQIILSEKIPKRS